MTMAFREVLRYGFPMAVDRHQVVLMAASVLLLVRISGLGAPRVVCGDGVGLILHGGFPKR